MSPRVSLSLPVYNGERYIAVALELLLGQSFADFELIITDNASNDATERICRAFADRDQRIRYVRSERNLGAAANFNRGFQLARGEYFKWCAHDDYVSQEFLEECVLALDRKVDVLAYGRQQGIDKSGSMIPWVSCEASNMYGIAAARRFRMVYSVQGFDAAMFGLIRREALGRTSLHRNYYGSDVALLAELALLGTFRRLPQVTFYNREHSDRSINIQDKKARQAWLDPGLSGRARPENLARLRHLLEIAFRHRRIAPLHRTLPQLAAWAATPRQLARYALDTVGMTSPFLQHYLRTTGLQILRTVRGIRGPDGQKPVV